ncbi:hypothetical protein VPH219E481_0072 [Vibrio phage 219E48-1]|nr:hypothetical protein PODOV021v1_p0060 [Vibrio phage 219E41.2]QZI91074.1 hypothetical protein PODOV032v1_p0069 [Vibrio phage 219E41.1]
MKTEMKKFHMAIRRSGHGGQWLVVEESKPENGDYFFYGHLGEVEIAVPVMTDEEIDKVMAGAELESLHKQREELQAKTHRQLMQIDERIGQLSAIENKG